MAGITSSINTAYESMLEDLWRLTSAISLVVRDSARDEAVIIECPREFQADFIAMEQVTEWPGTKLFWGALADKCT